MQINYVHKKKKKNKKKTNAMCRIATLRLLLRLDTGEFRERFGGKGRFKDGLRGSCRLSSVIIDIIPEINYRCGVVS